MFEAVLHLRRPAGVMACLALAAALLVACAVGPNFEPPAAPEDAAYLPAEPPAATASAPVPGGEAQRFIAAQDIPGQWWTLFQSPEMNALLEQALQHNPTLEAAQAALRQANENLAAERGAFYPSLTGTYQAQRADASLASFGLPGSGNYLYTLNSASVNVAYTLDVFGGIRRQVEAPAGAGGLRAQLARGKLSHAHCQRGNRRSHGGLAPGAGRRD